MDCSGSLEVRRSLDAPDGGNLPLRAFGYSDVTGIIGGSANWSGLD